MSNVYIAVVSLADNFSKDFMWIIFDKAAMYFYKVAKGQDILYY